jgi:hypothetical protein
MGESHPQNHPLWSRFNDFVDGHPTWSGVREVADEHTFAAWSLYLAGVAAGAAQEKDNARREHERRQAEFSALFGPDAIATSWGAFAPDREWVAGLAHAPAAG